MVLTMILVLLLLHACQLLLTLRDDIGAFLLELNLLDFSMLAMVGGTTAHLLFLILRSNRWGTWAIWWSYDAPTCSDPGPFTVSCF